VEKDAAQGEAWWHKAAAQGNGQAQFNLGMCYKNGIGVEKDAKEAVAWLRKAAAQGCHARRAGKHHEHARGLFKREWRAAH